ncbi:MAG: C25 family cysteine peptidase [Thermoanaerobaculia bacterium]
MPPPGLSAESARFRIETAVDGVVAVTYQELSAAGLTADVPSEALSLSNRGAAVPIWVADGGDGRLGPGDRLEFVAERLAGSSATYHEYSRFNVYWLAVDAGAGLRMQAAPLDPAPAGDPSTPPRHLERRLHLEEDRLLIRLRGSEVDPERPPELWHWAKLTHLDGEPWRVALDLPDLATDPGATVRLVVTFQGLSSRDAGAVPQPPDHRLEISLGGAPVARAEWGGRARHTAAVALPATGVAGSDAIELRIPRRRGSDGEPIVDVVMLDWVELSYPAAGRVGQVQSRFHLTGEDGAGPLALATPAAQPVTVYSDRGRRLGPSTSPDLRFAVAAGEESYWVVPAGAELRPERVELDRPSALAGVERQADYLMIGHRTLLDAVAPLAAHHRARGLSVEVVDVQDVYDEFNHGILDPRALRDFVAHAVQRWRRPAPRFVLLVGDASWDTKNATVDGANYANWPDRQLLARGGFPAKESAVYGDDPRTNDRNLVPTWNYPSEEGHAASDNWFVAVDGEDFLPDLAIGRLPLAEPEEVAAVVAKTIRYAERAPAGPWRSRLLWLTDEYRSSRVRTDSLAGALAARGFAPTKVYPTPTTDLEGQRAVLRQALADGHLLVHFVGHGGRFIWRTGPPDLEHQADLFGLEDVEALPPSERLPVVLAVTCYSAPFDHPNADSIGEAFLRVAERGAVAVIAASWRNAPGPEVSQALVEELLAGGTIGEALTRAKRRLLERTFAETYNLLGDPALALALPSPAGVAFSTPR